MTRDTLDTLALAFLLTAISPVLAGDLELDWYSIDAGGVRSGSPGRMLESCIGQPDVGMSTGGAFALTGGFLAATATGTTCPTDFDQDGVVGAADLAQMLGAWGLCGGCPQDVDGDGDVDGADLAQLLAAWGGCTGN